MLALALTLLLVLGLSTVVWSVAGLARHLLGVEHQGGTAPTADTVRVLIAARNEEAVIAGTLASAAALVPASAIHVVSDGSTDRTDAIALEAGAQVLHRPVSGGKANAIAEGIRHFGLAEPHLIVLLLDADTRLADDYLATGLPLFGDPRVAAVAGYATSARDGGRGFVARLLLAYRQRTYAAMQLLHKYGQAAARVDAVSIVPGFASMYRGTVIAQLDITAPGLAIEDFNMTFEVHARRLGRIAFVPGAAHAVTQDPDTLRAYARQMRRWNLGYWQTVSRHRPTLSVFWLAVGLSSVELIVGNLLLLVLVPLLVIAAAASAVDLLGLLPPEALDAATALLPVGAVLLGVLAADLLLSAGMAVACRRADLLYLAPCFPAVRLVDAVMSLRALAAALRQSSDGVWASPERRAVAQPAVERSPEERAATS